MYGRSYRHETNAGEYANGEVVTVGPGDGKNSKCDQKKHTTDYTGDVDPIGSIDEFMKV